MPKLKITSILLILVAAVMGIGFTVFYFFGDDLDLAIPFGVMANISAMASCICTFLNSIVQLKK